MPTIKWTKQPQLRLKVKYDTRKKNVLPMAEFYTDANEAALSGALVLENPQGRVPAVVTLRM
jgi:hypothetical protein